MSLCALLSRRIPVAHTRNGYALTGWVDERGVTTIQIPFAKEK